MNQNGRALWELKFEEKLIASLYIYFVCVFAFVCFCLFVYRLNLERTKMAAPLRSSNLKKEKKKTSFFKFCLFGASLCNG